MMKGKRYRYYQCPDCGHSVCSTHTPYTIHWNNGHTCTFVEKPRPNQKNKKEKQAMAIYLLNVLYEGPLDCTIDRQIEKACGRKPVASGYCFPVQTRDIQFVYTNHEEALHAQEKLNKLGRQLDISITHEGEAQHQKQTPKANVKRRT